MSSTENTRAGPAESTKIYQACACKYLYMYNLFDRYILYYISSTVVHSLYWYHTRYVEVFKHTANIQYYLLNEPLETETLSYKWGRYIMCTLFKTSF